jgi:transcriptional regulator with XRE-family HTH domain
LFSAAADLAGIAGAPARLGVQRSLAKGTQEEVAGAVGVSRATVSWIERGESARRGRAGVE